MPVTKGSVFNRSSDTLKGKRNYVRYVAGQGSPVGDSEMAKLNLYPVGSEYVDMLTGIRYLRTASRWIGTRMLQPVDMPLNADCVDQFVFLATRPCRVVGVSEVHATAGTDGGAVNVQVKKCTGTQAPSAGTALLTNNSNAGFNLKGAANTVQTGTLTATSADTELAAGDRLSLDFSGVTTSLAGVFVQLELELM